MNFFKNVTSSACVDYGIQYFRTWNNSVRVQSQPSLRQTLLGPVKTVRIREESGRGNVTPAICKLNLLATRTLLQRHPLLLALEIRSRNEEAINSTRNSIYLLKVLLLPISIDVDNFYLCLSWSSTRVRLYACTNTRKFKGLDSRELYHCQG